MSYGWFGIESEMEVEWTMWAGQLFKKILWKCTRLKWPRKWQSNSIQVNCGYLESGLILMFSGTFLLSSGHLLRGHWSLKEIKQDHLVLFYVSRRSTAMLFESEEQKNIPKHQLSVFHVPNCFYVSTVRKKRKSKETEMREFFTKQNNIYCCRQWFCWHINLSYY